MMTSNEQTKFRRNLERQCDLISPMFGLLIDGWVCDKEPNPTIWLKYPSYTRFPVVLTQTSKVFSLLHMEKALAHLITKTNVPEKLVDPVKINRYSFLFTTFPPGLLQRLLDYIFNNNKSRVNYTWVEPLQELLFGWQINKNPRQKSRKKLHPPTKKTSWLDDHFPQADHNPAFPLAQNKYVGLKVEKDLKIAEQEHKHWYDAETEKLQTRMEEELYRQRHIYRKYFNDNDPIEAELKRQFLQEFVDPQALNVTLNTVGSSTTINTTNNECKLQNETENEKPLI